MDEKDEILKKYIENIENCQNILNELKGQHKNNKYTVEDQIGKNSKVCFIFSCPGREELIHGKLCQGDTGENLNKILEILNVDRPTIFESKVKEEYDILNSTNIVHFNELDHKTEGDKNEINKHKQQLKKYLENNNNLEYVILCGNNAQTVKDVFKDKKIICSRHLGFQSINQIKTDICGKDISEIVYPRSIDRTKARLEVVAEDIIRQILKEMIKNFSSESNVINKINKKYNLQKRIVKLKSKINKKIKFIIIKKYGVIKGKSKTKYKKMTCKIKRFRVK